jgi:hypothetical protein
MRVRFVRLVGGLALAALLATLPAGCGMAKAGNGAFHPSGTDTSLPDAGSATSPPSALAPSAMSSPKFTKAVLDAYRAYQSAYRRAYESDNASGLSAVAMDPLLAAVTKDVRQTAAKRLVYRFTLELNPRVQTWRADRTMAVVVDCVRTVGWYSFSITTGKRVASGTSSPTTRLYRYAMRFDPGSQTWKAYTEEGGSKC